MMTAAPLEEATVDEPVDLTVINYGNILSLEGQALWKRHWEAIAADPAIDPRLRRWYLDPTMWTIAQCAEQLGFNNPQRVWILRSPVHHKRWPLPHPNRFVPEVDIVTRFYDREQPGFAAGMVRLWAEQRGTHVTDRETGALLPGTWTIDPDTGELVVRTRSGAEDKNASDDS